MAERPVPTRICKQCGAPIKSEDERAACWVCLLGGEWEKDEGAASFGAGRRVYQHYEVLRRKDGSLWELGRGAMGTTYKAVDKNLHAYVALKVINARFAAHPVARRHFLREARAAARLSHPNVAAIFHFGETAGSEDEDAFANPGECFYAMEFIAGETLEARLRRAGRLDVELALEIGLQVSRALAAAEKRGLVHCDLKPSNIMLMPEGENAPAGLGEPWVKVIDFGLAMVVSNANSATLQAIVGTEDWSGHTSFVGTPQFASPEQLDGEDLDVRSDIFSLGATLWYAITGEPPFTGDSLAEIRRRQCDEALPVGRLAGVNAPAAVVELLRSMLAAHRAQRPASALALQEALQACRRALAPGAEADRDSTSDPEALRLFRCAQWAVQGSFEIQARHEEAIRLLESALARDPGFVLARARLAELHALMFRNSYDRSPARARSVLKEAQAALRLSPRSGGAHRALGIYEHHIQHDYRRAREEFNLALQAHPDDAETLFCLGLTACRQSEWEEGAACFQKAAEMEPYRMDYANQRWRTLADMRRYAEARRVLNHLIAMRSEDIQLHLNRAYLSYMESADLQPIREVLAKTPAEYDPDGYTTFLRSSLARYDDDPDSAERILAASPLSHFKGFVDGQVIPRSSMEFLNAALRNDMEKVKAIASEGRQKAAAFVQACPDTPGFLMMLAIYDAVLGRREEAMAEGHRAVELLPVEKDGVDGPRIGMQLGWVYIYLGELEAGVDLLGTYSRFPGAVPYGGLMYGDIYRLIRHVPRFQALLESHRPRQI
jgi:serine/threonine protein kinase